MGADEAGTLAALKQCYSGQPLEAIPMIETGHQRATPTISGETSKVMTHTLISSIETSNPTYFSMVALLWLDRSNEAQLGVRITGRATARDYSM
jgi:hypothetical protein